MSFSTKESKAANKENKRLEREKKALHKREIKEFWDAEAALNLIRMKAKGWIK